MNAIDVVFAIRAAGGIITVEDGIPVVDAPADLPDTVWAAAESNCDEIVRLLEPNVTADNRARWTSDPASVSPADRHRWAQDVHARHPHPDGLQAVVSQIVSFVDDHKPVAACSWEDPFPRHRDRHDLPAGADCCDRCGSSETIDNTIHGGRSTRQDCARCGRLRKFPRWHGVEMP